MRYGFDQLLSYLKRASCLVLSPKLYKVELSQFAHWIFLLTAPLVAPFDNLHPPLPYDYYSIDVSTLVAILVYIVLAMIVLWFLRIFATWSRDY